MKTRRLYLLVGISLVLSVLSCSKDPVTGKSSYNWYSLETDNKLGQQVMNEQLAALKKENKPIDRQADPKMYDNVKQIADNITQVSHIPQFKWEFHMADVDVVNAWAAPGGKIMVYTGLYDSEEGLVDKNNPDEMAAVLSHEIAHATARHVTESLSRNYTVIMAGQVALSAVSASGASAGVQNMFHNVFVGGVNVFIPAYSRSAESEADRIGLFYMAAAGYNPQAARDLWYRACKKRGDQTSIFASHPSSCQRAKDLDKYLPAANKIYQDVKAGRPVQKPPKIPS